MKKLLTLFVITIFYSNFSYATKIYPKITVTSGTPIYSSTAWDEQGTLEVVTIATQSFQGYLAERIIIPGPKLEDECVMETHMVRVLYLAYGDLKEVLISGLAGTSCRTN